MLVAHVGIGDQEPQVRRDRDVARFERAAVDQERVAGEAAGRDILVHDAAAHADIVVLRPLADFRHFDRLERQPGGGHQRMRDAHFERGRGTQARAERHVGEDDEIGAGEAPTALFQHHGDAEHIVRPFVPAAGRRRVEVELARLVHDHRIDPEPPVGPRRGGDEGGEFERRRHDEAVVVVGVLADQVDPPRRAADFRPRGRSGCRIPARRRAPRRSWETSSVRGKRKPWRRFRQAPSPVARPPPLSSAPQRAPRPAEEVLGRRAGEPHSGRQRRKIDGDADERQDQEPRSRGRSAADATSAETSGSSASVSASASAPQANRVAAAVAMKRASGAVQPRRRASA